MLPFSRVEQFLTRRIQIALNLLPYSIHLNSNEYNAKKTAFIYLIIAL